MADADKSLKVGIETDASQAISEQERYNAKLKELADRTEAATQAAREQADAEAYAALKLELKAKAAERAAQQATEEKNYASQAAKEAASSATTYTNAMVEQITTDEKAFTSKKQLKDMFKQLGHEIPLLGQLGHLALNPIALAVAGITAAFAIFRLRVNEAAHAMARMELPDLSELDPVRIDAAAAALKAYSDALNGVVEKYNAIPAAAQRAIDAINAQAEREKKITEARKNLELAEAKTPEARLAIMNRYASFGVETDAKTRQKVIDEQRIEQVRLENEARQKKSEAAAIKVAPAETDAKNEADLKAQADAGKKAIAESRDMRGRIQQVRDQSVFSTLTSWEGVSTLFKYMFQHGNKSGSQAIQDENAQIANAQVAVDRYNNFERSKAGRDALRAKRDQLSTQAGEEAGQAQTLGQDIAAAQVDLGKDTRTNREVARLNALAEMKKLDVQQDEQAAALARQIGEEFAKSGKINQEMAAALKRLQDTNHKLEQQIAALSTNGAFN